MTLFWTKDIKQGTILNDKDDRVVAIFTDEADLDEVLKAVRFVSYRSRNSA